MLAAGFAYDYAFLDPREALVFGWVFTPREWVFSLSLVAFACYVLLPLATDRERTRLYWHRLRGHPLGLAAFLSLVFFFLVGLVGPELLGEPRIRPVTPHQPPVGVGVPTKYISTCEGPVRGGTCYGTWQFPLGTTANSEDIVVWMVHGLRVALEIALISAMLVVPTATFVGTTAAAYGGRVDDALMRSAELMQAVPAFFVYIIYQFVYEPSLLVLLAIFGVLSWGNVARMVRSEAVQRREAAFVEAAETAGASRLTIVRRHLVPNVSNTVVTAVTLQIPTFILVEAALSYLAFGDPDVYSLGWFISSVINPYEFPHYWWLSVIPAVLLLWVALALNLFGDATRDVLDPKLER